MFSYMRLSQIYTYQKNERINHLNLFHHNKTIFIFLFTIYLVLKFFWVYYTHRNWKWIFCILLLFKINQRNIYMARHGRHYNYLTPFFVQKKFFLFHSLSKMNFVLSSSLSLNTHIRTHA